MPHASSDLPGSDAGHASPCVRGHRTAPLFGLAPGGVCPATTVTSGAVRSYRTISPLPANTGFPGGIFSVALSVGSRPPGVTWHPALWSPDFPPRVLRHTATACPAPAREHHAATAGRDAITATSRLTRAVLETPGTPLRMDARWPTAIPDSGAFHGLPSPRPEEPESEVKTGRRESKSRGAVDSTNRHPRSCPRPATAVRGHRPCSSSRP